MLLMKIAFFIFHADYSFPCVWDLKGPRIPSDWMNKMASIMLVIASKTKMCIASGVGLGSGFTGRGFDVGYEFARPVVGG